MGTVVIVLIVAMIALALVVMAGGMDRVRRSPTRTVVREPEVVTETPVVRERVVERPVVRERITERRVE